MSKGIVHTQLEQLEARQLLSTSAAPYLVSTAPGVTITPLMTTGDSAANGYRMVGIPDGLGAFDNGDGTFTVLMNHELRSTQGITRAHGNKGAFVSKWIISKSTGEVLSDCGYEPRTDASGVTLANCPFHALAQDYTDLVCGMNLDLMDGLLDALGRANLEARLDPEPGRCCVSLSRP